MANAYACANPDAEVRWSVVTASKGESENGVETDVIVSDGNKLCCISCKRRLHQDVIQELEQHCNRTAMLGGIVNKSVMAMYKVDSKQPTYITKALKMEWWNAEIIKNMESGRKYVEVIPHASAPKAVTPQAEPEPTAVAPVVQEPVSVEVSPEPAPQSSSSITPPDQPASLPLPSPPEPLPSFWRRLILAWPYLISGTW